jgi:hypothetical protein
MTVRVHGPRGASRTVDMLVDTGADEVMLPAMYLPLLGFDPTQAQQRTLRGVGGPVVLNYFAVEMELVASPTNRLRWRTNVGFGRTPGGLGLFGVAGGLEFFHLSMNVIDGWFSLHPHPLLGTLPPTAYPHTPYPIP